MNRLFQKLVFRLTGRCLSCAPILPTDGWDMFRYGKRCRLCKR